MFTCLLCGYADDRDLHAAKNMIRLGSVIHPTRPEQTGTLVEGAVRPAADMDFSFIPATGTHPAKQEAATSLASP